MGLKVGVEVNQVPFEEDGGHLPVMGIDSVDEDKGKGFWVRWWVLMDDLCLVKVLRILVAVDILALSPDNVLSISKQMS